MKRMSRRDFLARAAVASVALSGCGPRPVRCEAPAGGPGKRLEPEEWRAMEAVQSVILPSGPDSPGAREVNATPYLDAALAFGAEPGDCETVKRGAARLDALAREGGAADYASLEPKRADEVLRAMLEAQGNDFFVVVLGFTLEALLGDPIHGGNPDGVGWRWLGHTPGWPRPRGA